MEPAGQAEPGEPRQRKNLYRQARQKNRLAFVRKEEMQTLLAVQQAITSRLEPKNDLQIIADEACWLTGASMSALTLLKESCLEVCVVSGGAEQALVGYQVPLESSLAGEAVRSGKTVVVEDTTTSGLSYEPLLEKSGVRSFVIVPLFSSHGPLGTITIASRAAGSLGSDASQQLQQLVPGAVLAVENARLYAQAQQAAALEERYRLYNELHDAVTQTLFSANLIAEVLPRLWELNPQEGQARLAELCQLTRGALDEMRVLLDRH